MNLSNDYEAMKIPILHGLHVLHGSIIKRTLTLSFGSIATVFIQDELPNSIGVAVLRGKKYKQQGKTLSASTLLRQFGIISRLISCHVLALK